MTKRIHIIRRKFDYGGSVCLDLTCFLRNLNLLEYQAKGLLEDYGVTIQKFKMATNPQEVTELRSSYLTVDTCRLRPSPRPSRARSMSSRPR